MQLLNLNMRAKILLRCGQLRSAREVMNEFDQVLDANPDFPHGFHHRRLALRAMLANSEGRFDEAMKILDEFDLEGFTRGGIEEIFNRELRIASLAGLNRVAEAISSQEELIRRFGGRTLAHFRLGELLERAGRPHEACRAYERSLALWHAADPDYPFPAQARARLRALGK